MAASKSQTMESKIFVLEERLSNMLVARITMEDEYQQRIKLLGMQKVEYTRVNVQLTQQNNEFRDVITQLQTQLKKLLQESEMKSNDINNGIQSVLNKIDTEFAAFKDKYNEPKLVNSMNQTPHKLLDQGSELNKEINSYKEYIEKMVFSSKSFAKYIQDIDGIIDRLSSPDLANYKHWKVETILVWIRGIENGRFVKYIDILKVGLTESGIGGQELPELSRGDLTLPPFNITHFKDTRDLIQHFKLLKAPIAIQISDQPMLINEGAPTE
eukprot:811101_1